jgi:hypothetical protein
MLTNKPVGYPVFLLSISSKINSEIWLQDFLWIFKIGRLDLFFYLKTIYHSEFSPLTNLSSFFLVTSILFSRYCFLDK